MGFSKNESCTITSCNQLGDSSLIAARQEYGWLEASLRPKKIIAAVVAVPQGRSTNISAPRSWGCLYHRVINRKLAGLYPMNFAHFGRSIDVSHFAKETCNDDQSAQRRSAISRTLVIGSPYL